MTPDTAVLPGPAAGTELLGRSVWLRAFEPRDLTEAYVDWLNDPEAVRYSNLRFRRHTRASCERELAELAGGPHRLYSLRLQADDRAIGTMTVRRSPPHGTAEVELLIGDTSVWGQGHGRDAWRTMTEWLAGQPGVRKITAGMPEGHQRMRRLAERSGMQLEAVRRAHEVVDGRPQDFLHYARFTAAAATSGRCGRPATPAASPSAQVLRHCAFSRA